MQIPDIRTARLRLAAMTPAHLEIQAKSPQLLGPELNAIVPETWPDSNWEPHVYEFMGAQFRAHPNTIGWHRYVLLPENGVVTLVGALGAHPVAEFEAEIGYSILQPWQRHGYATEAARALIGYLFENGCQRIRAQTFPHLTASLRVMAKCGLEFIGPGEEQGAVCYGRARVL
jgi:[ribosomal protein S5]-alanine N-acetyltransferase